jgi:hypothetical protein
LAAFLPCSPANHVSVRNRLHRVAAAVESAEISSAPVSHGCREASEGSDDGITVLIDGAHIRAAPGHQTRHLDVTVGKIEAPGRKPRRFALAPLAADRPLAQIRAALTEQGWTGARPVTVISDGEAALPELVRRATRSDIHHILDWWHISMRVRHAEQALAGVYALEPIHRGGLDIVEDGVSRLRHLLWNGYHHEVRRELFALRHLAYETVYLNGERLRPAVTRFIARCEELRSYLENNEAALVDYSCRYHSGQPVSMSRAEGCVDEIANARMAKQRRLRWSPRGAHRIAVVRAAVLDGRLHALEHRRAAQQPGFFHSPRPVGTGRWTYGSGWNRRSLLTDRVTRAVPESSADCRYGAVRCLPASNANGDSLSGDCMSQGMALFLR